MNVIDAADMFADRRWDPAQFVKSCGQDPLVYRDQYSGAPLSLLPEDVARFLVRVINTARHHVPVVRRVTSVLWCAANTIELRYAPEAAGEPDVVEPPKCIEMLDGDVALRVSFRAEPAGSTATEVA